ncbi:MAG: DUF503 domain-containing protein [bacterium]|nr:DUF503 domain-containing protein [bacterium]
MIVGTLKLTFRLYSISSLKEKRGVVKKMVERTKNRFNASVAETALNDFTDKAEIGIAVSGNDAAYVNSKLDKIVTFIDDMCLAELVDTRMEIINI